MEETPDAWQKIRWELSGLEVLFRVILLGFEMVILFDLSSLSCYFLSIKTLQLRELLLNELNISSHSVKSSHLFRGMNITLSQV